MVDYYIGTMGFSYKDWAGSFYPPGAPARDYLIHYSRVFNAVEIDSTFYGIPKPGSIVRWKDQSPEDFKICLKVPRSITHEARLVDTHREMEKFLDTIAQLEDKLGVILIQFPPSFEASNHETLEAFLHDLPKPPMYAVEFRHPSWYVPETESLFTEHSICWVATEFPGVPQEVPLTTEIIFIRLVGEHGRFRSHDREQIDTSPQLVNWWNWIKMHSDAIHTVYVFLNDDYSGHAPATANRLKEIIGLDVIKPDIPKQMSFL
jgi:uncharacterized protein YecE (DUF72 family)